MNTDWQRDVALMLQAYGLTMHDILEALPRVVSSLSPDEVALLHGADLDHPELLNEEQAGLFCTLIVRAAALLGTEWSKRELAERSSHN